MIEKQHVTHGRKFAQVSEGATRIFLRDGYAGASVDDIAATARVSKATLYSYFSDKRLMFEEAMRIRIAQIAERSPLDVPGDAPPEEALPVLARQIAQWLVAPANLRLHRLQVAEAVRFPALAQAYHAVLGTVLRDPLRRHLEGWAAEGRLRLEDGGLAADQFIRLAGAGIHDTALLAVAAPSAAEIEAAAEGAARMFLACHAVGEGIDAPPLAEGAARNGGARPEPAVRRAGR